MKLNVIQLERYIRPLDSFVTRAKYSTYEQITTIMRDHPKDAAAPYIRAIGYHPTLGWFILQASPGETPFLLWSERAWIE